MSLRIAYLHHMSAPGSQKGGPGVHIAESVRALRAIGHTVEVFGPALDVSRAPVGDPPRPRSALRRSIARYGYQPRAIVRSLWRARDLERALWRFGPDIVLARYEAFEIAPLVCARRLDVPLVWEVNGTSREIGWFNPELVLYPGTLALERATLHAGAAIFVVSDELRRELGRDGIDLRRVGVVPNGADPDRFSPQAWHGAARTARTTDAVVGFLGSFSRWHDVGTMALAMARVAQRHPEVRFVLAGAAWEDMPTSVTGPLGPFKDRLILPGVVPINDAPGWMARFDVALSLYPAMPHFYFSPVKLFEYLASGAAVVATAIGQQSSVLRDGINGYTTPPGDVDAVTARIEALVDDPALRTRIGAAARATVLEGYTWGHNAERIAALCTAALRARRRGGRVVDVAALSGTDTVR